MVSTDIPEQESSPLAARLRAAREASGITQAHAAAELGMSRPTLIAIEKGTRDPRPTELVRLAELYGENVSALLRPVAPPASMRARFRAALPAGPETEPLGDAVAELERYADNYLDLLHRSEAELPGRQPPVRSVEHIGADIAGEQLAIEERNRLGLGDGPIQSLREILEIEVGLRIFFLPLPSQIAGLFMHVNPLGGCIGVNQGHPAERRRWTMAHEYAHYLSSPDRPEITKLARGARVPDSERFADAFAGHFLMPRNGITRRFHELTRNNNGQATPAMLVQLAHTYRVSVQALCLRLEDLKLIRSGTWDRLRDHKFQPRVAARALNLPAIPGTDEALPLHYRTLATQLFVEGEITETQFARYLGTDIVGARREFERLTATGDVSEDGSPQVIGLWSTPE